MSARRKSTPDKPAAAKPAAAGKKSRRIAVEALARVEGEGGLDLKVRGDRVVAAQLKIYEPPRFFEAFLRGRSFREVPDITARICGICPIAYMNSSSLALEAACGVEVDGQLRALRRLIYCGEWIESHVLHIYLLHAPDFLGYPSAIHLAGDHPEVVAQALAAKKVGNDLMDTIGGRSVHPINLRLGGFYSVPSRAQLAAFVEPLKRCLDQSLATAKWTASLPYPDFETDTEYVALRHPDEYPLNEGRLVSTRGLDIDISEFEQHFDEEHVAHANALQGVHRGKGPYQVGPVARFNLNFDRLGPAAREAAALAKVAPPVSNPFQSIAVRAVELVFACEEALRLIGEYEPPAKPFVDVAPRAGEGCGCTEAPRGICWHRYRIDEHGNVLAARIVPPTAQNQKQIEADLVAFVERHLAESDERLTWLCEQAIRNYDPCISCATHFLRLTVDRG